MFQQTALRCLRLVRDYWFVSSRSIEMFVDTVNRLKAVLQPRRVCLFIIRWRKLQVVSSPGNCGGSSVKWTKCRVNCSPVTMPMYFVSLMRVFLLHTRAGGLCEHRKRWGTFVLLGRERVNRISNSIIFRYLYKNYWRYPKRWENNF